MKQKLYEITWLDARGVTQNWEQIKHFKSKPSFMKSYGIIIEETKSYINIAPHHDEEEDFVCGVMTIPKCSIKRKRRLK